MSVANRARCVPAPGRHRFVRVSGWLVVSGMLAAAASAVAPVTAASASTPPPPPTVVYIANAGGNTVSVYNQDTDTITATIPVGSDPTGIGLSPDNATVYVANYDYGDFTGGTLSEIHAATNTVTATLDSSTLSGAYDVKVIADGSTAYVTSNDTGIIQTIDTATNTLTFGYNSGGPFTPTAVAAGSDDSAWVIINGYGVVFRYTPNNTNNLSVSVGNNPSAIAVAPDAATVYVTNQDDNTVSVIDVAADAVTNTIGVGTAPNGVAITPDGATAYVTNSADNTVSVINTATGTVTATIPVGSTPSAVAVTPSGTKAYVANTGSNTVSVINTATNTVTKTLSGFSSPDAIAIGGPPSAPAPAITGITPASGPLAGGTSVTITGTGFTGATAVQFGSTAATSFTVNSDTSITATAPAATGVGTVDVTVTTAAGTSLTSPADRYSYAYAFVGFFQPVDNPPVVNTVQAGRGIPVKFSLGGNQGLNILAPNSPFSQNTTCGGGPTDPIETTTNSNSGLTYDPASGQYTYVWMTDKAWQGSCRTLHVTLADGTDHTAYFQFK